MLAAHQTLIWRKTSKKTNLPSLIGALVGFGVGGRSAASRAADVRGGTARRLHLGEVWVEARMAHNGIVYERRVAVWLAGHSAAARFRVLIRIRLVLIVGAEMDDQRGAREARRGRQRIYLRKTGG